MELNKGLMFTEHDRHSIISDTVLNDLVRRVLDKVSEHSINDSAHFSKV